MYKWRQWLLLFVWRNVRRHKMNAMQFIMLQRRPGQREMSAMNWIKRPTKKSDIHVE